MPVDLVAASAPFRPEGQAPSGPLSPGAASSARRPSIHPLMRHLSRRSFSDGAHAEAESSGTSRRSSDLLPSVFRPSASVVPMTSHVEEHPGEDDSSSSGGGDDDDDDAGSRLQPLRWPHQGAGPDEGEDDDDVLGDRFGSRVKAVAKESGQWAAMKRRQSVALVSALGQASVQRTNQTLTALAHAAKFKSFRSSAERLTEPPPSGVPTGSQASLADLDAAPLGVSSGPGSRHDLHARASHTALNQLPAEMRRSLPNDGLIQGPYTKAAGATSSEGSHSRDPSDGLVVSSRSESVCSTDAGGHDRATTGGGHQREYTDPLPSKMGVLLGGDGTGGHANPNLKLKAHNKAHRDFTQVTRIQTIPTGIEYDLANAGLPPAQLPSSSSTDGEKSLYAMNFSRSGRYLAVAGHDAILRIYTVRSRNSESELHLAEKAEPAGADTPLTDGIFYPQPTHTFHGHSEAILELSWSYSNFIATASMDHTVRIWHVNENQCLCVLKHVDCVTCVAFHPHDDRYVVTGSLDGKIRLWSLVEKQVMLSHTLQDAFITAIAFTSSGSAILAGTFTGVCVFFNFDGLKYITQVQIKSGKNKSKGRKITGIVPLLHDTTGSGEKMIITTNDSRVRIYNVRDKSLVHKYKGFYNSQNQIKATPTDDPFNAGDSNIPGAGIFLISGSENKQVYIWNVIPPNTGQQFSGLLSGLMLRQNEIRHTSTSYERFSTSHVVHCALFAPKALRRLLGHKAHLLILADYAGQITVYDTAQYKRSPGVRALAGATTLASQSALDAGPNAMGLAPRTLPHPEQRSSPLSKLARRESHSSDASGHTTDGSERSTREEGVSYGGRPRRRRLADGAGSAGDDGPMPAFNVIPPTPSSQGPTADAAFAPRHGAGHPPAPGGASSRVANALRAHAEAARLIVKRKQALTQVLQSLTGENFYLAQRTPPQKMGASDKSPRRPLFGHTGIGQQDRDRDRGHDAKDDTICRLRQAELWRVSQRASIMHDHGYFAGRTPSGEPVVPPELSIQHALPQHGPLSGMEPSIHPSSRRSSLAHLPSRAASRNVTPPPTMGDDGLGRSGRNSLNNGGGGGGGNSPFKGPAVQPFLDDEEHEDMMDGGRRYSVFTGALGGMAGSLRRHVAIAHDPDPPAHVLFPRAGSRGFNTSQTSLRLSVGSGRGGAGASGGSADGLSGSAAPTSGRLSLLPIATDEILPGGLASPMALPNSGYASVLSSPHGLHPHSGPGSPHGAGWPAHQLARFHRSASAVSALLQSALPGGPSAAAGGRRTASPGGRFPPPFAMHAANSSEKGTGARSAGESGESGARTPAAVAEEELVLVRPASGAAAAASQPTPPFTHQGDAPRDVVSPVRMGLPALPVPGSSGVAGGREASGLPPLARLPSVSGTADGQTGETGGPAWNACAGCGGETFGITQTGRLQCLMCNRAASLSKLTK